MVGDTRCCSGVLAHVGTRRHLASRCSSAKSGREGRGVMLVLSGLISGDLWEKRPQNLRQEPPFNSGDHWGDRDQ